MLPIEVKDVERGRRLQKRAGGNEQQLARGHNRQFQSKN